MNRLLACLVCSLAVAVCPAAADPGGPVLDRAGYICVTPPGIPCPPTTREITVVFDELIDPATGADPANYLFHPVDDPDSVITVQEVWGVWDNEAFLFFTATPTETNYLLTVSGVEDLDGNPMAPGQTWVVEPMENPSSVPDVVDPTLLPNVPNPFNPVTAVRFVLPETVGDAAVTVAVHDLAGRLIRSLPVATRPGPGLHEVEWNGMNHRGRRVASGAYVVRLSVGEFTAVRKIMLAK